MKQAKFRILKWLKINNFNQVQNNSNLEILIIGYLEVNINLPSTKCLHIQAILQNIEALQEILII